MALSSTLGTLPPDSDTKIDPKSTKVSGKMTTNKEN